MSLSDGVFTSKNVLLKGTRRDAMMDYVKAVIAAYPANATRTKAKQLLGLIKTKSQFTEKEWTGVLAQAGLSANVDEEAWSASWCKVTGPGVGGYPCGMWLLFHTLLANSDRFNAQQHLAAIRGWVVNFFGCTHCAAHFQAMWKELDGEKQTGHVDTTTWLWEAHNRVRERLADDDTVQVGSKNQWPGYKQCETCYTEETRASVDFSDPEQPPTHTAYDSQLWQRSYVFDFMQEIYCFGSDTFACSQFYDPSIGVERDQIDTTWVVVTHVLEAIAR
jgi:hypothetical protein